MGKFDPNQAFPLPTTFFDELPADDRDLLEVIFDAHQPDEETRRSQERRRLRRSADAHVTLLQRLLPVVDAVDRLLDGGSETSEDAPAVVANYLRGLAALRKRLQKILQREGVVAMECLGLPVDLDRHEVVEVRETGTTTTPIVVEVREQGYLLGDQVLRDAKVVAARATSTGESTEPDEETNAGSSSS